jgi:DNA polymerase-3 subunit delta'
MAQAYAVEGRAEEGVKKAREVLARVAPGAEVVELSYGLLSAEEAREVAGIAAQAPLKDAKAIVIAAGRAYHEAQNALLKIFEEPPPNTFLFLILPSLGGLLPTLRSRVEVLKNQEPNRKSQTEIPEIAKEFIKMSLDKRSNLIKKLATGRDEEERRENRDEALAIVNGVEAAAHEKGVEKNAALLADIGKLRSYLHDRSAPVRMILEHLSLVLPKDLL